MVFVRGSARSGTTLLSDIMNESPEIGILVEQPLGDLANRMRDIFWFERHRDEQRAAIAAASARAAAKRGEHYEPIENPERMRFPRRYPMRERLGSILAAVVGASLEKPSLRVIGSKTPGHWSDYELRVVEELFERVSFVFIVRNPLETINSIVNRRNAARKGLDLWPDKPVAEAVSRYREGVCLLLSCASTYPDRTYVVRYDDLIARTEATLSGLGRFLGLELKDSSGLVRESRPAKTVLTRDEERAVRAALGPAIDAWPTKRFTGMANEIGAQLDDCLDVAGRRTEYRFDAPTGERGVLGSGWSGAEPNGIWSDASLSDVWFRVPDDGEYRLTVTLSASVGNRRQPLTFETSAGDEAREHVIRHGRGERLVLGPVRLEAGRAQRLRFSFDEPGKRICLRRLRVDKR